MSRQSWLLLTVWLCASGQVVAVPTPAALHGAHGSDRNPVHSGPLLSGMPASPHSFEAWQPDGKRITLYLRGDARLHWLEDSEGYAVVKRGKAYVYAQRDGDGESAPSSLLVGSDDPARAGLVPGGLFAREVLAQRQTGAALAPVSSGLSGRLKNLVILLRFANHTSRTLPSTSDIDTVFNAVGGDEALAPTGSVTDFYLENSYGALTLESTVVGWVTLPGTEQYYADGRSGLGTPRMDEALLTALDLLDPLVDLSRYDDNQDGSIDAISFVHSGYAAEHGGTDSDGADYDQRIWSHRGSIPTWTSAEGVSVTRYYIVPAFWDVSGAAPVRIGVICHELGHFLGLPDLYDRDPGPGAGIGSHGLMANSWGFSGTQLNPPYLSAWSKIQLGWLNPTVIHEPGAYEAPQVETHPVVYRLDLGYPRGEYLLIENRQPVSFESTMPQGGLAIWHIDESAGLDTQGYPGQPGWPQNGNHYRVALLQADGNYDLERGYNRGDSGDLFHGGGVAEIGPFTVPGTFGYQGGRITFTGNTIEHISESGPLMRFRFTRSDTVNCNGRRVSDMTSIEPMPMPQTIRGSVTSTTSDICTFQVCEAESYTFTFCREGGTANFDTHLCLLNTSGDLLAQSDNSCGALSEITADLDPGSYVVVVSGQGSGEGSYSLAYFSQGFGCRECAQRRLVSRGSIAPDAEPRTVSGTISYATSDAYTFEAREAGTYTFTFCRGDGTADYDTWICLLDATGRVIAQNDDSCELLSEVRAMLAPGTYTVAVSGYPGTAGSYTLAYFLFNCNGRAAIFRGELGPTPEPRTVRGRIQPTTAALYTFEACGRTRHTFTFCVAGGSANYDTWLCLLDDSNRLVAANDNACGTLSELSVVLDPGAYSISVSGSGSAAGQYNLTYFVESPSRCTRCNGRILVARDEIEPTLATRSVSGSVTPAAGESHSFEVCERGRYTFTLCSGGGSADYDTLLCLLDSSGNVLVANDDACGLLSEVSAVLDPGRYAIAVSGYEIDAGSYTLAYFADVRNACDPVGGGQVPGDCNQDGMVSIADAVCVFRMLFQGAPAPAACGGGFAVADGTAVLIDWQPDGSVNLSDGIAVLRFLFAAGPAHHLTRSGAASNECVPIVGCSANDSCP